MPSQWPVETAVKGGICLQFAWYLMTVEGNWEGLYCCLAKGPLCSSVAVLPPFPNAGNLENVDLVGCSKSATPGSSCVFCWWDSLSSLALFTSRLLWWYSLDTCERILLTLETLPPSPTLTHCSRGGEGVAGRALALLVCKVLSFSSYCDNWDITMTSSEGKIIHQGVRGTTCQVSEWCSLRHQVERTRRSSTFRPLPLQP